MNPANHTARPSLASALGLALLSLSLLACGGKKDETAAATAPRPAASSPSQIVALGRTEPEGKIAPLSAEVTGVVKRLRVREGEVVAAGQVLVELSQEVEAAKATQLASRLVTQQAQILTDASALARARILAENADRTTQRIQKLTAQGAETQQSADNARTESASAAEEVLRLQSVASGSESRLAEMRADLAVAQAELARRTIRAPSAGTVLQLTATPGSIVTASQAIGDFAPEGAPTALCEVDELYSNQIELGQAAYIRPQGSTDTLATGTVIYAGAYLKKKSLFAGTAGDAEDRRVREVRIRLTPRKPVLYNSRVEVVIPLKGAAAAPVAAPAAK
jgi:HlyD family secretion protein